MRPSSLLHPEEHVYCVHLFVQQFELQVDVLDVSDLLRSELALLFEQYLHTFLNATSHVLELCEQVGNGDFIRDHRIAPCECTNADLYFSTITRIFSTSP